MGLAQRSISVVSHDTSRRHARRRKESFFGNSCRYSTHLGLKGYMFQTLCVNTGSPEEQDHQAAGRAKKVACCTCVGPRAKDACRHSTWLGHASLMHPASGCGGCAGHAATAQRSCSCTASAAGPVSPACKKAWQTASCQPKLVDQHACRAVHDSPARRPAAYAADLSKCMPAASPALQHIMMACLLEHIKLLRIVRFPCRLGPPARNRRKRAGGRSEARNALCTLPARTNNYTAMRRQTQANSSSPAGCTACHD